MADQLFKKRQAEREKREQHFKKLRSESWLFVCEGEKTEPIYINSLIKYANSHSNENPIKPEIKGIGKNTESLVLSVEEFFDYTDCCCSQKAIPYSKVFVVFDKDSFKPNNFNNAIFVAKSKGYIPLWSNECFELWLILHYDYYDIDNGREAYFEKLSKLIGHKYQKNEDLFSMIHTPQRLKTAMKNATALEKSFKENSPAKMVPCTQMYKLIVELQERLKINLLDE